jgi:COP9 signalosome complex subunit 3
LASLDYITSASGLSGKLSYQLYLEYFLYGAMIFMGLKKWDDALHFLHVVLAAPANHSVSMIMVQAYKKWVLVCLLAKGTVS